MTCNENMSDLNAAERQYYQLIKQDDNFKRRFPDEVHVFTLFTAILDYSFINLVYDAKLTILIRY